MPSKAFNIEKEMNVKGVNNNDTWMDGLHLLCHFSGVGVSQNQRYREDGTSFAEHECEDRSIHLCLNQENNTFLYGVFDGHDGSKAASFSSQKMAAELSFEQLEGKTSEADVKEIFRQSFTSVENAFLESIDPLIAERTQLLEKIPNYMKDLEAVQQYPDTFHRLEDLEEEIKGGTTAVVALLHRNILYIGNVGDSRALLCQKDKSGVLKVKQLTADHSTSSFDELERLKALSLDVNKIKGGKLGGTEITRCIGNYFLKGGYKEFDILSSSTNEPVICEPHIASIHLDESCSFLLLMSDGLYKSYEEATGSKYANKEIATMVVEQFFEQPTLTSVAQTVVDKVVRLHHDAFLTEKGTKDVRDDITLVIRNFNFHFPTTFKSHVNFLPHNVHVENLEESDLLSFTAQSTKSSLENPKEGLPSPLQGPPAPPSAEPSPSSSLSSVFHASTTSSDSSKLSNPSLTQLTLDDDGRIRPYVCFEHFFRTVDEAIASHAIPKSQIFLYK